jgi:15-cis-phytoene synthase
MTVEMFNQVSNDCSKAITLKYSTSFSSAIRMLHKDLRKPIFNIYGFVRLADEIVDTFHVHDKKSLLSQFRDETFDAIERGISLNPVLNSFQQTVTEHEIDRNLIHAFFRSMEYDLTRTNYDRQGFEEYVYGSAEVVGLMCLAVFCDRDQQLYHSLTPAARSLGAAFQKVNFLRDIQADFNGLSRMYFPGCDFNNFTEEEKSRIEKEIEEDFRLALIGIGKLPMSCRFGVYVAYKYYYSLFSKIRRTHAKHVLVRRIRIANYQKAYIVARATIKNSFGLI